MNIRLYLPFLPIILLLNPIFGNINNASENIMLSKQDNFFSFDNSYNHKELQNEEYLNFVDQAITAHPEFGQLPYNAPCDDCFELLEKRTLNSRYFIKEGTNGSKFYQQNAYGNLHYLDKDGWLQTINYHFKPDLEKIGVYTADRQADPVKIDLNCKTTAIQSHGIEFSYNRNLKLIHYKNDGSKNILANADWSDYSIGSDGMIVYNIFPGVDMEIKARIGGMKTNFIVTEKQNITDGWMGIEDELLIPPGHTLQKNQVALATLNDMFVGNIDIVNTTAKSIFVIHKGIAHDQNIKLGEGYTDILYKINNTHINILLAAEWLNNETRKYPVVIDPLVTSTNSLSAPLNSSYSATCNYGEGCQYSLIVPSPANTTITDIRFSLTYEAEAPCYYSQAGFAINLGSCFSSWTCNQDTFGFCYGNNLSTFSQLSACIPAPACDPYDMNFKLYFYRCIGVTGNCNTSCISIPTVPWSVTVYGQTVDAISISPLQTSCPGDPVTLTADATWGVPPYRYLWLPDSVWGKTIDVFPTKNTNYRMIVIDTCGLKDSLITQVNILPTPDPAINIPECVILGECFNPDLKVAPHYTYYWSPTTYLSCTDCPNPQICPEEDITYLYVITDTSTYCQSGGNKDVKVCVKTLEAPSAFTPNGDGPSESEKFKLYTTDAITELLEYKIFNRWGQMVFEGQSLLDQWDGTYKGINQQMGVYTYIVEAKAFDGEIIRKTGRLTLIR